ncbi:hypothetical protein [Vibrio europaeus]|uniref:hypothetical protein n=1 Tax=Vibrio europaeus TaxID=300876 RepID=UPI00233EDFDF|nr:hypothetical protein [Vibrio europaeus]MDC5753573.1 hypothetical protein [Vibrio europaeus]MDC5816514.1 hypothetical protein [Vibrio europaeus]
MLYSVAAVAISGKRRLLDTNSFSKAREAYLSALRDKSLKVDYKYIAMACSGRIINQNKLSDQLSPSQVRSN